VVGDEQAVGCEAVLEQLVPHERRWHHHGGGLPPRHPQPSPVEPHAVGREVLGIALEHEVVHGDDEGPAAGGRHGEARRVHQVARRPHHGPAQPLPRLVGQAASGERHGLDSGGGQVLEQALHVTADATGHRLA